LSRTIVITGGASGIGRAAASVCAARGDRVAILDKDAVDAPLGLSLVCDVTDEAQVRSAFDEVVARLGTPWGVFANAGIDLGGPLHELPIDRWRQLLETNLTGIFLTCKHALRLMVEAGAGGSLVCTSSIAALTGFAAGGAAAYSATKGGVSSLVRCLAVDYARYGIRVNAVLPGSTETRMMWANVNPQQVSQIRGQLCREIPLGRIADPEEPAKAAAWLLSDESSYVTGTQLVCDGGVLAKSSLSL
jgi:NAD(P)-dependent dehydrogenase (short-subunit alcohol dehydrogenase family)